MMLTYLFICLVFCVINDAAKILAVFPTPSISHQVIFKELTEELAKRGHHVTVITPDPAFSKGQTPEYLTEIDVHDISYKLWGEYFLKTTKGKKQDIFNQIKASEELKVLLFEAQMKTEEVTTILNDKSKNFDLLLLEAWFRPCLALSHKYKIPVIQVSSFGGIPTNFKAVGASIHPILYPNFFSQKIINLSLWDKITELYNYHTCVNLITSSEDKENEMIKRIFGPDIPSLSELSNNVDMTFLNLHWIWDTNRPVPPSVVYMGALHIKPEKKLPEDLKSYLDSSRNGVIYMSFGTNLDPELLPQEKIQIIIKVFSQLPYNVLMKWNKDTIPGLPENIKLSKWLPQQDVLRHPNVKLFITQGGLQSTDEAIAAGVPLIGIPMVADQWFNCEKYEQFGIGVYFDLEQLTEERLKIGINTVANNNSYRENIVNLRSLLLDQPQSALERAVWWTEYVIRHRGAKHLRAPTANMSWTIYYEIKLVSYSFVTLLILSVLCFIILKKKLTNKIKYKSI